MVEIKQKFIAEFIIHEDALGNWNLYLPTKNYKAERKKPGKRNPLCKSA